MVKRSLRSKNLKKKQVRTPGGRVATHYKRVKKQVARCKCGRPLSGVARATPSEIKNMPRSSKKTNRPFANLCPECMRQEVINRVRRA